MGSTGSLNMGLMDTLKSVGGYDMAHSWLHPEEGYDAAAKEQERAWREAQGYMRPFQQAGASEIPRLRDATGRLLNPEELQNQWAKGYETSPYAKDQLMRSQNLGLDAASSMGLMGSSPALENIQRTGSSIVAGDRQRYMDDLIQKYLAGVQSSQNIFGTGAGVGNTMGQGAMQSGENLAQMRYNSTNAPGNLFGGLLGGGLSAAGTAMTGMPMNFGNLSGGGGGSMPRGNNPNSYRPWGSA